MNFGILMIQGLVNSFGAAVMAAFAAAVKIDSFAYMFAPHPSIGVWGIWWAIPIGWFLADLTGILRIRKSTNIADYE